MVKCEKPKNAKFATLVTPGKSNELYIGAYYGKLSEGDLVVCNFYYGPNSYVVKRVATANIAAAAIDEFDGMIIGKVDTKAYDAQQELDRRKRDIMLEMSKRAKAFSRDEMRDAMAAKDPELAKLWEELKKLED